MISLNLQIVSVVSRHGTSNCMRYCDQEMSIVAEVCVIGNMVIKHILQNEV